MEKMNILQKFSLGIIIPVIVLVLTSSGPATPAWEKENVSFPMMNQEIRNTMYEHERQKTMHQKQLTNLALETNNKKEWTDFKKTTAKIQERLRFVDFAMQAIPTGYAITLEAQRISTTQQEIINAIANAPYAIAVVLPNQLQFVNDMQMVVRLLIGIVASYGAINQMEKAERKILLDYALNEVKQLRKDSAFMLMKVRDIIHKVQWNKTLIKYYINRDVQIVKDIMSHF